MTNVANLFIIGFPRCGTSTLYNVLAQSPDVFAPSLKEPHHYGRIIDEAERTGPEGVEAAVAKDAQRYSAAKKQTYRLDGSTTYSWHPRAADRIHAVSPDAKLLVMLRDPVVRAISHLGVAMREGHEQREPDAAIQHDLDLESKDVNARPRYVGAGRYATHLAHWLNRFSPTQMHVIFLEDWQSNREASVQALAEFLGISPGPLQAEVAVRPRHNAGNQPRNRVVRRIVAVGWLMRLARRLPAGIRQMMRDATLVPAAPPPLGPACRARLCKLYRQESAALADLLQLDETRLAARWPSTFSGESF